MILSRRKTAAVKGLFHHPLLALLFVLLLIATAVPLLIHNSPRAAAEATCTGGKWENVRWKNGSPNVNSNTYVGPSNFAQVEFDWTADKNATAGSSFEFKLPSQLKAVNTGTVVLTDNKGEAVATGTWKGDKFIITLTDFQDRHFDVHGTAYVAVAWNINSKFDGQLDFTGCGTGQLNGKFEQRESGLFHDDGKIGEYRGFDEKNKVHIIHWSVGIDPKKHKNEGHGGQVLVTDDAPDGWKFACDGKYTNGYAPVYVSSFIAGSNGPIRHAIYPANGYPPAAGTLNGVTGITSETIPPGHNYTLNCTEQHVYVQFPYGLSDQSGPVLTLTAFTETKPKPGSTVTNKAKIDNVDVEGHVVFPDAGGQGRGSKGGFTLEKLVVGTEADKTKEFTFEYECTGSAAKDMKKGTITLKHEDFTHVSGLNKGLKCKVKENTSENKDGRKLTTSWIITDKDEKVRSIGSASEVDFTVDSPEEEAIHVVVTNKYEQNGEFSLKKKVEGVKTDKKFKFEWVCTTDKGAQYRGENTLADGEETTITGLPLDSTCKVTETPVSIKGHTHMLRWLSNGEESGSKNPFTLTPRDRANQAKLVVTAVNKYTPADSTTGGFTLEKKVEGLDADQKDKEFKFTWQCRVDEKTDPVIGSTKLKANQTFKVDNLPVDSTCTIAETEAEVDGYKHAIQWFTNDEERNVNPVTVTPRSEDDQTPLVVKAVNSYTPVVPPVPTTVPTTSSSTSSKTTEPTTTSSTYTKTTEPTTSSSTSTKTTEPTTSSSTTTKTTEPTTTSSTTTNRIPPIIPIPIPIPIPPAPQPPAPTPAPQPPAPTPAPQPPAPTPAPQPPAPTPAPQPPAPTQHATPSVPTLHSSAAPQPGTHKNTGTHKGKGVLAKTGASVIWILIAAILFAGIGGLILYRAISKNSR
ncbi:LPxTG domain-containing protein [Corynebacterium pseudotuberculosis]|nr:LPxTG domain-containing protein [Corynebacterium pseudotuberculosis]AZN21913.1 LPxTG domain-containing protein [Corynebacterium pseudotuberculosis]QBB90951.1 LPxTG domain-containing protein [Corynebacterium pseudotuberculosis]QBB97279.1 LPxTG domain-containing protein [Corynebacterium pseudotuberculosis]QBF71372.1 LPxTG domain-containing protein [Corynebacterium pseudotuberculosis]